MISIYFHGFSWHLTIIKPSTALTPQLARLGEHGLGHGHALHQGHRRQLDSVRDILGPPEAAFPIESGLVHGWFMGGS